MAVSTGKLASSLAAKAASAAAVASALTASAERLLVPADAADAADAERTAAAAALASFLARVLLLLAALDGTAAGTAIIVGTAELRRAWASASSGVCALPLPAAGAPNAERRRCLAERSGAPSAGICGRCCCCCCRCGCRRCTR